MSRLIDADILMESIRGKEIEMYLSEHGDVGETYDKCTVMDIIDTQPTAYNPDKVVEQLKESTVIGADCVGEAFDCIPTFRAIDIVKSGGIDNK